MMERSKAHGLWQTLRWCAFGMAGVVALTFVAFRLHLSFAVASFGALLLLIVQSLSGNFASAVVVSVLAVGCLDYFFTEPIFSLEIYSPFDMVGLAAFLITGLVITKLVTKLRDQTQLSLL